MRGACSRGNFHLSSLYLIDSNNVSFRSGCQVDDSSPPNDSETDDLWLRQNQQPAHPSGESLQSDFTLIGQLQLIRIFSMTVDWYDRHVSGHPV